MTPTFADLVGRWHDFYVLVGTAAATLIGLLFVGLSLNIRVIRRDTGVDLQELAGQSGNNFFYVLAVALFFLIPDQTPLGLGLPLLILGLLGLLGTVSHMRKARAQRRMWGKSSIVRRFTMPIVSLAGLVAIALSALSGETAGVYALVLVIIVLLASATQNAWDLLIKVDEDEHE